VERDGARTISELVESFQSASGRETWTGFHVDLAGRRLGTPAMEWLISADFRNGMIRCFA
jgi:hypothetical protein